MVVLWLYLRYIKSFLVFDLKSEKCLYQPTLVADDYKNLFSSPYKTKSSHNPVWFYDYLNGLVGMCASWSFWKFWRRESQLLNCLFVLYFCTSFFSNISVSVKATKSWPLDKYQYIFSQFYIKRLHSRWFFKKVSKILHYIFWKTYLWADTTNILQLFFFNLINNDLYWLAFVSCFKVSKLLIAAEI